MAYEKELEIAIFLAKISGKKIMEYFKSKNQSVQKKHDGTLVTKADTESENIILEGIKNNFPVDGIVSEESDKTRSQEREWHIDPLDGTGSFLMGETDFSINIGLCKKGLPVLGVVFKPATNELYFGVRGESSYKVDKNGKKIKLSVQKKKLTSIIAAIGFNKNAEKINSLLIKELQISKTIKIGSTGLKILSVAEGNSNLFFSPLLNSKTWDFCAPQVILESAGGIMEYLDKEKILYTNLINLKNYFLVTNSRELMESAQRKLSSFFKN